MHVVLVLVCALLKEAFGYALLVLLCCGCILSCCLFTLGVQHEIAWESMVWIWTCVLFAPCKCLTMSNTSSLSVLPKQIIRGPHLSLLGPNYQQLGVGLLFKLNPHQRDSAAHLIYLCLQAYHPC